MTNHADLIAALRIPMDVTLPCAPELDEYDEQRKAAADALDALEAIDAKLAAVDEGSRKAAAALGDELARGAQAVRVKPLVWDADGRRLSIDDDTMAFSASYDWDGYECLRQEGYGLGCSYIIWPDSVSGAAWNVYGTLNGVYITGLDGPNAAQAAAQADYERWVLASIATRPTSEVWAEATAAAYGAAYEVTKSWYRNVGKGTPYAEIEALTPQSARDWLAAHDAEVYRRGQENMRERAAEVAYYQYWSAYDASDLRADICAIPIKEKDDE